MSPTFPASLSEDSSERYDSKMYEHRSSGEVKVRLKRVLPSRSDIGEVLAADVADFGALTSFVKQHCWYGDASEFAWTMVRRGKIVCKGDLVLDGDVRIKRLAEQGDWPLPHEALFNPTARRSAQAPPLGPQAAPQPNSIKARATTIPRLSGRWPR